MLAVCGAAWRWGGRAERRFALLISLAWLALLAAQAIAHRVAPVGVLAALDVAVFVAILAMSWRHREDWLVFATAVQGVAVGVHAIRLLTPRMDTWTYLTALAIASYGLLLLLAWATWRTARRPRRR